MQFLVYFNNMLFSLSVKAYIVHVHFRKRLIPLKCYYDQIFDTHFFTFLYTIGLSKLPCQISIYYEQYNPCVLDLSFREFMAAINFGCSKSGLRNLEKMTSFSQKYHTG